MQHNCMLTEHLLKIIWIFKNVKIDFLIKAKIKEF